MSVDPLWEKYLSFSPYQYSGNNPVNAYDVDGRAINGVTAAGGFVIGGGVEYVGQVVNNLFTSKAGNFSDKLWNACVRDIDQSDIMISATAGGLAGATLGLSLGTGLIAKATPYLANAAIGIGEDYTKSQTGSKTEQYRLTDAGISALGAFAGELTGAFMKNSDKYQNNLEILRRDANRAEKLKNQRGRNAQVAKAKALKNKADKYMSYEGFIISSAVNKGVSNGIHYLIQQGD